MKNFFAALILMLCCFISSAQRLERFGNNGVSYADIKTLYGNIPTENIRHALIKDTVSYFVYLWLPDSASEISVRMFSPVPKNVFPNTGEKITEDFKDPPDTAYKKYFDTEIWFEKATNAFAPQDAFEKTKLVWRQLGHNDNSGERNNSLLRIVSDRKKNIHLSRGLYRVRFRAHEEKNPEGTFMLQLGLKEMIPGVKLFRLKEELQ